MKKAITEWLGELPDGYRERALEAFGNDVEPDGLWDTLHDALDKAFVWDATPEGENFWQSVYEAVRDSTDLPVLSDAEPTGTVTKRPLAGMPVLEYDKLLTSGMFWEWYPDATGVYAKDCIRTPLLDTDTKEVVESPDIDPKKGAGDLKCPLHLVPTEPVRTMAKVLALGMKKYGIYNWRNSEGVGASTYSAAIMRHLFQYMDGEDVDEESGESHLAHIMATCAILLDAESVGKLIDNRTKAVDNG